MTLIRINRNPSGRQLWIFGLAWALVFGAMGMPSFRHASGHRIAAAAWVLVVAIPLLGLVLPGALRLLYLGMAYATYPIGFVVSHVILVLVYYLVFTPIGWGMKLFGYDPLARRFDRSAGSYWIQREPPRPPESYFNQN